MMDFVNFILQRITSSKNGTFGALVKDSELFCMTLELQFPKLPAGLYKCEIFYSLKRGYDVYKIDFPQPDDVPLEFHIGNTIKDTTGCILVGSFDPTFVCDGLPGIFNSKIAFDRLMATKLPYFWLKVIDING
jgi:hypothetical protein